MPSLTKAEKAKGQVVFATTLTALLIQKACQLAGLPDDKQPAVQQCTLLLSELLDPLPADVRNQIVHAMNKKRILLTSKVEKLDTLSSLVGAIDVITGKYFKSKPGTRFDFIRQTLRENLPVFLAMAQIKAADREKFAKQFVIHLFK